MEFRRIQISSHNLTCYSDLMQHCFPSANKYNLKYMSWLYSKNPDGTVFGYDAFSNNRLAAHYACIPVQIRLFGNIANALLSLNTATHPDFQRKGLFTKLAELTYKDATDSGYSCVFGVANTNSTPGFCHKLGFQLVAPLEARLGIGHCPPLKKTNSLTQFERHWSSSSLAWRCANPSNPIYGINRGSSFRFYAKAKGAIVPVFAELILPRAISYHYEDKPPLLSPFKLYIGLQPSKSYLNWRYVNIPKYLRPSPLNFIFLPLNMNEKEMDANTINLSFLDFDAY